MQSNQERLSLPLFVPDLEIEAGANDVLADIDRDPAARDWAGHVAVKSVEVGMQELHLGFVRLGRG